MCKDCLSQAPFLQNLLAGRGFSDWGELFESGSCNSLFTVQISLSLRNKFPVPFRRLQLESRCFVRVSRGSPIFELLKNQKISCDFPDKQGIRLRRPVWRDRVHHQEVRAKGRDFLVLRIARHFRGLWRQSSVCQAYSTVSAAHWRRVGSKVSGRKSPFPRLLLPYARRPRFRTALGVRTLARWVRMGWISSSPENRRER
jgi:hypothetical protein